MNTETINQRSSEETQIGSEGGENKGYDSSSYPIYLQPSVIDWYSVNLYATYYQDTNKGHSGSSSPNLDEQKIVVNVIKDNSSPKSILKSNTSESVNKKEVYTSPNTVIGSRTMNDLFEVMNKQRSTIEHVIIIDRPDSTPPEKSIPITTTTITMIPSTEYTTQQPIYYSSQPLVYQQPKIYTSIPNNIYFTTAYVTNAISYYPFVYYSY